MTKVAGPGDVRFASKAVTRQLTNYATAITKGDVVAINEAVVDSDTNEFDTVKQPVTADLDAGIFAVALEDVAASAQGMFALRGRIEVRTNGAIALGDNLGPVNAQDYLDQVAPGAAANAKVIGKPLETQASGENLTLCEFDGINGFGYVNA